MILRSIKSLLFFSEPVDDFYTPTTSKFTRMEEFFFTCGKLFKSAKRWPEASLFPPSADDKLAYVHAWPEGIQVFERAGKRYVYFRNLDEYELYIQIQEGNEQVSEKREHAAKYLRVVKCKED